MTLELTAAGLSSSKAKKYISKYHVPTNASYLKPTRYEEEHLTARDRRTSSVSITQLTRHQHFQERPQHKRNTSTVTYNGQQVTRYYYDNSEIFEKLLKEYNQRNAEKQRVSFDVKCPEKRWTAADFRCAEKRNGHDVSHQPTQCRFECVGCVNVGMRMCVRCRDTGKKKFRKDRYYINKLEIAQQRTILCHGCMGEKLHNMETRSSLKICVDKA